jgi:hypothetical protein
MKTSMIEHFRSGRYVPAFALALALGTLGIAKPASADTEQINWHVFLNQPIVEYFDNEFNLEYPKLLTFTGAAENPSGFSGSVTMFFDYADPNDPNQTITTLPVTIGVPEFKTVNFGFSEQIPYCPSLVSLHARTADTELIEVAGTFTHDCLVPEPSTALAALAGVMGLGLVSLRRS